jgi:CheY-like chemotaxis protein
MTTQNHRILVVDDSPDNLFLMKVFLESEGHSVETAENGQETLKKIQSFPPDLMMRLYDSPPGRG